ncbi:MULTISPECIES: acetyl-CoA carboxylase biotin carboxyl carrier protein subunit [Aeribacillus]|uniref:acetyl-CoA carboxylase biotin carboxyl carrier protein subunit n=1 Tax=Aeribacillus TaxID=1055323 RepID=UPI000E34DA0F|nr:acetyl-CoA carboxylase biotin carboxyl carrier protein subunit [Aeribacillus pallidus]REJ21307.1 MAG: acetyl-CoA carboxylase biotin carboxyl carrier protein subunit [Bacillaceae bacterium]
MNQIAAIMAGNVWKVIVSVGEKIEKGQDVVILESMKMEIPIAAEANGIIKEIHVREGDFVNEGDILLEFE